MSDDVSVGAPETRRRTATVWLGVAVAAIAIGAATLAFALSSRSDSEKASPPPTTASPTTASPTVTATPAPAADPTRPGELEESSATSIIEAALDAPLATAGTADDLQEILKDLASDSYSAELEAQWQELASQGWTVHGSPSVVSTEVTSIDADSTPAVATVTSCVDSSSVIVADAAGQVIGDDAAKTPRALHIFTLTQGDDDRWRISAHSFPDDPIC